MIPPKLTLFYLVVFSLAMGYAAADDSHDSTIIFGGDTPDKPWNGWGFASPPDPHAEQAPPPAPEQFDVVEDAAPGPRIFSGKVVGPASMDGVVVGLVSLVGIHWVMKDTYQWQPVAADGSFSLTDANHLDASKALVVRGPETPWTFLRYNFSPAESARNIVLKAASPKKMRLTASGPDINTPIKASYEIFDASKQFDDKGRVLRRQRLGKYDTSDNNEADVVLPRGEVAIFVGCPGFASYYQIADTRRADHFHFVLMPPGQMKITVLDAEGNPKGGLHINWHNPAAPLSYSERSMGADGVLVQGNLVPGTFQVNVAGFEAREVKIDAGKETDVTLQEGKDP